MGIGGHRPASEALHVYPPPESVLYLPGIAWDAPLRPIYCGSASCRAWRISLQSAAGSQVRLGSRARHCGRSESGRALILAGAILEPREAEAAAVRRPQAGSRCLMARHRRGRLRAEPGGTPHGAALRTEVARHADGQGKPGRRRAPVGGDLPKHQREHPSLRRTADGAPRGCQSAVPAFS